MISDHLDEWVDRQVEAYQPGTPLGDPASVVYALRIDYDDPLSFPEKLEKLLSTPGSERLEALIIGTWAAEMYDEDSSTVVQALARERERLPQLKHLFLGEITYDEAEISWINQSDLSPLLKAFPRLQSLVVRGGNGLGFKECRHENLKTLIVESGGLPGTTIRELLGGHLPALETLELWFGREDYGGNNTVDDLAALHGRPFPKLVSLGLCNAQYTDSLVTFVTRTPLLDYLRELDLSLGTLGDAGAQPLLDDPRFARLELLDLSDNYLSEARCRELKSRLPNADVSDQRSPEDDDGERYCSVGE